MALKHRRLKLGTGRNFLAVAVALVIQAALHADSSSSFATAAMRPVLQTRVLRTKLSTDADSAFETSATAVLTASLACGLLAYSKRATALRAQEEDMQDLLLNKKAASWAAGDKEAADATKSAGEESGKKAASTEAAKKAAEEDAAKAALQEAAAKAAKAAEEEAAKAALQEVEDGATAALQEAATKAAKAAEEDAAKAALQEAAAKAAKVEKEAAKAATQKAATKAGSSKKSSSEKGLPPAELAEIRREIDAALTRVEELEIEGEAREKKLRETEEMASGAVKKEFLILQERENLKAAAEKSQQERDEALAKVQGLEQALAKVEARAKGLEKALSAVGSSVGAALMNVDLVEGEASLYSTALQESEENKELARQLEQEKGETLVQVEEIKGELSETKKRLTFLEGVEARAEKLSAGIQKIFKKTGADRRRGFFSFFSGRSDEDMVEDTLKQLDEIDKKKP